MDLNEVYEALAIALRRVEERQTEGEQALAELRARFDQVVDILQGGGVLNDGHRALVERVAQVARREIRPRVRLRQYIDKYQMKGADVDCAARMHLCHARCCSLSFELTVQDLDEGKVHWEVAQPYIIRHELDGYCSHLNRATGFCGVYEVRPATCRGYDCRSDPRIWIDFEKGIPAPMPAGLQSLDTR
jgi:hypothetical protein